MLKRPPENISYLLWLALQCLLTATACFFLFFGISLFRSAYKLNDPFIFIMMIFSSNLIILVSAALLIGFIYRIYNVHTYRKNKKDDNNSSSGQDEPYAE